MEIAYYPGCSLTQSSELYSSQTKKVLSAMGVGIREIEDWSCCGATSATKTNDFLSAALPARNIGIAENAGYKEMVIPCTGCYTATMMAQKKLIGDAAFKDEVNTEFAHQVKGDIKISTIVEVLQKAMNGEDMSAKVAKKLKGLVSVCYYGCITRFPEEVPFADDVENPTGMESILEQLGVNTLDWNYKTFCCGASAAINDQETSLKLMSKIMADAVERGANNIVVSCPMCQMNMDAFQDAFCRKYGIQKRLPVYFITELLGVAMGMSPVGLQIDRHFIDGIPLLKELDLI